MSVSKLLKDITGYLTIASTLLEVYQAQQMIKKKLAKSSWNRENGGSHCLQGHISFGQKQQLFKWPTGWVCWGFQNSQVPALVKAHCLCPPYPVSTVVGKTFSSQETLSSVLASWFSSSFSEQVKRAWVSAFSLASVTNPKACLILLFITHDRKMIWDVGVKVQGNGALSAPVATPHPTLP